MSDRVRTLIVGKRTISPMMVAVAGAVLAVLSLLGNNAGLAIIFASLVIPVAALVELSRRDVFEDEPRWASPAMLGWGAAVGIVMAVIASVVAAQWWISGAPLHVGAAGFGGSAAEREGSPGFLVLLFNGIILPSLGVTLAAIGAYGMRRYPVFRNEVMDGVTLGAAAGCGLATGTTVVFVWPIIGGGSVSGGTVADWTATVIGVLVTRPIILGLAVSFVCAGVWHVALTQRSVDLVLPVAIGLGGAIVFVFGDLLVQPSGSRAELFWHVLMAVGLAAAARVIVGRAVAHDRLLRTEAIGRVTCPTCGASTPPGQYCATCGSPLQASTMSTDEPAEEQAVTAPPDEPPVEVGAGVRSEPPQD